MKSKLSKLPIFLTFIALAFNSHGQLTLTSSNFARGTTFPDSIVVAAQTAITLPAHGAAQTWDYSNLTMASLNVRDHFDATSDPNFTGALNHYSNDLSFQGFIIPSNSYEAKDNNGWYEMGRSIQKVSYSIASISGGPNDTLTFVGDNAMFGGRINLVTFPMTYQDQWTQSHTEITNFELTVAAFSLNKTPGNQKRINTQIREVVGYGTLTIPTGNSSPPSAVPALLVKVQRTQVDSFFVGGMVAPSTLTGAFGLSQGATFSDEFYVFYTPGFGAPVMSVNIVSGAGENAVYRPGVYHSTFSIDENFGGMARVYPNPLKGNQPLTIETPDHTATAVFKVFDLHGRQLCQLTVESVGNEFRCRIPSSISTGMYLYTLQDEDGRSLLNGKFQKVD